MMWDFAAGNNNEQRNNNGYDGQYSTPPFGMPSPSFPGASPPSVAYTDTSTYSSNLTHSSSYNDFQSSPSFLAVPGGPDTSRSASAQGYQSHQSHSHHHHHHRHHSNPSNSAPLLFPPSPAPPPPHHRLTRPVSAYDIPSSSHSAYDHHQQRPPPQQRPPQQRPPQPLPPPQQSQRPPQQQHQSQQVYSTCTGRKKALCIGINYIGHPRALRGCINDARHVHDFLIKRWGYKHEDIVMLTDDSKNPRQRPTRANIIDAMRWLVKDAQTNDSLFFHYSGHGGQTRDLDGDEIDGYDEVIYPMDFERSGHLTDDIMHRILVKSLPRGCRLTALFDCCHSGTVLDMPYIYRSDGKLKGLQIKERTRMQKATNADVITWSGSKDGQTSADTFAGGVAVGAMSYAFITSLTAKPNQTYQELLKSVRKILYDKYSQKPQLSSSHHIDTNMRFVM